MEIGLLQVTKDCNQDCIYCTREVNKTTPSLSEIKEKIDSFENVEQIIVTGGEPLLRDDIFEIVHYASTKAKVHLQTNGLLITKDIVNKLEESNLDSILIHIPTLKKSTFHELSQINGNKLKKKFESLKLLAKSRIKTGVVFVVNSLNYHELYDLSNEIFSISNDFYLQITNMIRFSNDSDKVIPLVTPLERFDGILNKTLSYCNKNNYEVRVDGIPLCFINEKYHKFVSDLKTRNYEFDENFIDKRSKYDDKNYTGKERVYLDKCKDCDLKRKCKGFYRYYDEYYTTNDIKEISKEMPRIDIRLGYMCNNNCLYCCVGTAGDSMKSTKDVIHDLLDGRKNGARKVSFTGGEPTIRKDIFYLVKKAKDLGYLENQVITNGRMLSYPKFFDKLIKSGVNHLAFSLDSLKSEVSDKLNGIKGSHNQLMKAIENAKEYPDIIYTTITVMNSLNYKELPDITKFLVDLKEDLPKLFSEFMFLSPEGNVFDNEFLVPRLSEVLPYVKKSLEISKKHDFELNIEAIPPCLLPNYTSNIVEFHMSEERLMANPDGMDNDYNKTRQNELKTKTKKCIGCKYYNVCEGLHKGYLKMFDDSEIKPL
ncbi:MAG: radical SAM protein [Candidatus Woesearchaeota archaeon]